MDLDNFIIGKTKERGDLAKKQQLLSKHRATVDDKNSQKNSSGPLVLCPQAAHWTDENLNHIKIYS